MKVSNTSERLKELMKSLNLRQVDILEKTKPFCNEYNVKMNKSDISQYVSGLVEPGQEKLFILSKALNVSEAWLMGYDVPRELENEHPIIKPTTIAAHLPEGVELTEEEQEQLDDYIQFILSRRKK